MKKTTFYLLIFSIAMGFLESAVVIYLRELYYPEGFDFPLKVLPARMALVELFREAATVIMLVGVAYLAGKNKLQRFAFFSLAFAIWDLCYYLFLFLFLQWPPSLFTWDILFLIPVPWVGPVWAPCLLCLLMILGSLFVIRRCDEDPHFKIAPKHWFVLILGAAICILAFMWDYLHYGEGIWPGKPSADLCVDISTYVPCHYNNLLFFSGFILMVWPVAYQLIIHFRNSGPNER